jgi:hypothetical protein
MRIKFNRKLSIAVAVMGVVALLPAAVSAASKLSSQNPQTSPANKTLGVEAAPVPDQCVLQTQKSADEQKYRLTYNAPQTYTDTSLSFFNVKCGLLTFTVPRGQEALVDFTAAAELDCQAPNNVTTPTPTNGWCEARFLVNTVNVLPNNTGRGDTFAWDSSNGGTFDWQANTLDQVGRAVCPRSDTTQSPCTFHAQLQARLDNGATSLWVDDLTVRVDVSPGNVTSTTLTP